jgi:hypothetical protein
VGFFKNRTSALTQNFKPFVFDFKFIVSISRGEGLEGRGEREREKKGAMKRGRQGKRRRGDG